MKRSQFCIASLILAALTVAGCQRQRGASTGSDAAVEIGPKYRATSGLFVPEDTRQSIGLKTGEVVEQKVPMMLELSLRVYRANATVSLASGLATSDEAKFVKAGQDVQVVTDDGHKLAAQIKSTSEKLGKATELVEVLVEIPNHSKPFAVGTFLKCNVTLEAKESVVTIPRSALIECSDGYSVYTASGDNFVRTPVTVGATNVDLVEIRDGLYVGDVVVLKPVMSLWMTELAAVKGGQACCAVPGKGK
jgi:multidrug efflux pump subunit AcrA (membrane-fusion protein)